MESRESENIFKRKIKKVIIDSKLCQISKTVVLSRDLVGYETITWRTQDFKFDDIENTLKIFKDK